MAVFLGNTGNIRLRRAGGEGSEFADVIQEFDVNTLLNRLGFDKSADNLLTGDRVDISTTDARGLVCFAASNWSSNTVQHSITGYVHVNSVGGLRFFPSFSDAVNNNRSTEYTLYGFAGAGLPISVSIRDSIYNVLGNVTGYEINTTREAVDTTALNDKFKTQYSAGLISGSGKIDCIFDYKSTGIKEVPLMLLQTIQRVEVGSHCDIALYLIDNSLDASNDSVFYEVEAVITSSGVTVDTDGTITCTLDFVTTGEIRLLVGEPSAYILKEDDDRVELEQSVDYLLKEIDD